MKTTGVKVNGYLLVLSLAVLTSLGGCTALYKNWESKRVTVVENSDAVESTEQEAKCETPDGMVKGSLSKEAIRDVVNGNIEDVNTCYEEALKKDESLEGRVAVKFIINGNGSVQMAAVENSTLDDENTENCIARAVRYWRFPAPECGGIVIVTYPFELPL